MLNTNITFSNNNFDTDLFNLDMEYPNDPKNPEFSFGLITFNFPYFIKEYDFLKKKRTREFPLDNETIEQGIKKAFFVEKENEKNKALKEKEIDEKQNEEIYFIQSNNNSEKIKYEIKRETEFNELQLNEKEKKEIKEKENRRQKQETNFKSLLKRLQDLKKQTKWKTNQIKKYIPKTIMITH